MIEDVNAQQLRKPVLIVEDSDDDFESTRDVLQSFSDFHCPIKRAENGLEAVDYLNQIGEVSSEARQAEPCLILLDLNLPGVHGSEVLAAIKSNAQTCHIPVVVFSNSQERDDVNSSYLKGANSFVSKPGNLDELVATLQSFEKFWFTTSTLPKFIN